MQNAQESSKYKQVRGLSRGLEVLYALNLSNGGTTIAQLVQQTGLHRTTIRRILETLITDGYVRRSESDDSYWLALKVRDLSDGFQDEAWVASLAAPLLSDLLPKVLWPTDICTLSGTSMVIRETTHRFSRLSFHRQMVGRQLPLLLTAAGRSYLSFCPDDEREQLLDLLRVQNTEDAARSRDDNYVQTIINTTRKEGYARNYGEWKSAERFAAIALPIRHQDRVYACLNLIYMAQAMSPEVAAEKYLAHMQTTVDEIERGLNEQG